MILVEAKHSLKETEVGFLQSLLGQSITSISCKKPASLGDYSDLAIDDAVKLQVSDGSYMAVTAELDETQLGENFITIKIKNWERNTNAAPIGQPSENSIFYPILPMFIISAIEVYGESYQVVSENKRASPLYQIQKKHIGEAITELIETENLILLYSTDGRLLLISPYGVVHWMTFSFDETFIQKRLSRKNLDGDIIIKLKLRFG